MDKLKYSRCPLKKRPIMVEESSPEDHLSHGRFKATEVIYRHILTLC